MQEQSGVKTWQWVITVLVIIVLIVLGYYMFKSDDSVVPAVNTDGSAMVDTSKETNRVNVTDQFPGNIVYVSSVQFANPGFVVIHADKDGKPGDVIGYQYFDKGIFPGKVTLTKSTVEGGVYYAMLHSDNGDKKFDITKDLPLKDSKGNIIMKLFRATSSIQEVKG